MARQYVLGENSARKLRELFSSGGGGSVRGAPASLAFEDEFAHPFDVRWAASAGEDGAQPAEGGGAPGGSWIIWLPSRSALVSISGKTYDPTEFLEEVGGDYPPGWYCLDADILSREDDGELYLAVGVFEEGVAAQARFVGGAHLGLEEVSLFKICETLINAETGERQVRQFVSSAILVADGVGSVANDYFADERSISQMAGSCGGDPTQMQSSNVRMKQSEIRTFSQLCMSMPSEL